MPTKIIMPQLGESVVEGTVIRWLVAEGDKVDEFDPILEVTTDKVDTEVTASASGTVLKLLVTEGTTVQVGTLLGWIGESGDSVPGSIEADEASQPGDRAGYRSVSANRDPGFISPAVARLATEYNVDIRHIKGSGRDGRVTKKDVLKLVAMRTAEPEFLGREKPSSSGFVSQQEVSPFGDQIGSDTVTEEIRISRMRRTISDRMVFSKHTAAHVTTMFEVDMSDVVTHRLAHKGEFADDNVNLTFTAYFVAATATALIAHPIVNSSLLEDKLMLRKDVNIGVAVSLGQEGLIVPVIRDAAVKSLRSIAEELGGLVARARNKQLLPDEVHDATFTITNHGISGSLMSTPIINQPQCAILGVGAIQKRAIVIEDSIVIRPMVYLTLSFDHRIIDGAIADTFLSKVKAVLEGWV